MRTNWNNKNGHRFEIQAGNIKMRLSLGEMETYTRTYGKNVLKYRYS